MGILDHGAASVGASHRISLALGNETHLDAQEQGAEDRRAEWRMVNNRCERSVRA